MIFFFFAERLDSRLQSKYTCPKKEGALASNEFICKYKIRNEQNNRIRGDESENLEVHLEADSLSEESGC